MKIIKKYKNWKFNNTIIRWEKNMKSRDKIDVDKVVNDILTSDYVDRRKKSKNGYECMPSVNILTGELVFEFPVKNGKKIKLNR